MRDPRLNRVDTLVGVLDDRVAAVDQVVGVVAAPAHHGIRALPAVDRVIALAAQDGVIAVFAVERIVAGTAGEDVDAAIAGNVVVEAVAGAVERVGALQVEILEIGAEHVADRAGHPIVPSWAFSVMASPASSTK